MCGFAGFVDRSERMPVHQAVLRAMSAAVAHRGPDGEGFFVGPRLGLGVAHRRLAIIDRTPAAAQPMLAPGGRWLVAYNGELRPKLKEAGFLTRDPREVERKKYGQPGARKRFQFSKR